MHISSPTDQFAAATTCTEVAPAGANVDSVVFLVRGMPFIVVVHTPAPMIVVNPCCPTVPPLLSISVPLPPAD
jgi:hypothetical protein